MASMDDKYLVTLFKDFGTKTNSIRIYVDKVKEEAESVNRDTIELVDLLKKKYEIIDKFRQNKKKVNPAAFLSLEASYNSEQATAADESITDIDASISQRSKQINHHFDKSKKELQTLAVMFQDMATLVNEVYDTYNSIIEERM